MCLHHTCGKSDLAAVRLAQISFGSKHRSALLAIVLRPGFKTLLADVGRDSCVAAGLPWYDQVENLCPTAQAEVPPRFADALPGNLGSKERDKRDRFTKKFKQDAVAQVVERGYAVSEVAERLGISTKSLYTWKALFSKPVPVRNSEADLAAELRRLKKELVRVTEERDILKEADT